jgi:hypothetical protein
MLSSALLQSFGADASVVANVQASLTGGTPTGSTGAWCHTFNTNISAGSSGSEADALAESLKREGSPSVTSFQEKYKDEILTPNGLTHGTGYVGVSTRKKLNQLYGCSGVMQSSSQSANAPSITVISPNGGETIDGDQSKIYFSFLKKNLIYKTPQYLSVYLVREQDQAILKGFYMGGSDSQSGKADGFYDKQYMYDNIPGGLYRIRVQSEYGDKVSDISDAPFTVTSLKGENKGGLDVLSERILPADYKNAAGLKIYKIQFKAGNGEAIRILRIKFKTYLAGDVDVLNDLYNFRLVKDNGEVVGTIDKSSTESNQDQSIMISTNIVLAPEQLLNLSLLIDTTKSGAGTGWVSDMHSFIFPNDIKAEGVSTGSPVFIGAHPYIPDLSQYKDTTGTPHG